MTNIQSHSIASILAKRSAKLKGKTGNSERAESRARLTQLIEHHYPVFEPIRDALLKRTPKNTGEKCVECPNGEKIIAELKEHGLVNHHDEDVASAEAKRYLGGGWLEELAWLAAVEAGAHEAIFAQSIGWEAKGYYGQNEIDLIVRKNSQLGFLSCKAVGSYFDSDSRKHRNRLMDALHEADNLADHFGTEGDRVGILVTADLIDEVADQPRYMALMGKAAVLDVRIIPLEELGWEKLVAAIGELMD
jgi:hypothetical protein